ncbi:MAG TPA: NifU family protein [Candidatus Eisenbacteria bacterium]|nr:NifU family protein [Candidatus Eisenbacteria bacterium]
MTTPDSIQISAEVTPNPNTLKFNVNKALIPSGTVNFPDKEKARGSKLAEALFAIENVLGVMVGQDWITVTKAPASSWQTLVEAVTKTIRQALASGDALVAGSASAAHGASIGEIEKKIIEILDNEIRPAVNMDGGDITFHGYYDGVVTLHLQGSCSSCPSSIMTLKMGVENRLKSMIPEIREVVQV